MNARADWRAVRQAVYALCAEHGLTLEVQPEDRPARVHTAMVWAPPGRVFGATFGHVVGLFGWDTDCPDPALPRWVEIAEELRQIAAHGLKPCPDAGKGCEQCDIREEDGDEP